MTVDPSDPVLDDDRVAQFFWYHTSTHANWPVKDFDPSADLTSATRSTMGGKKQVAKWASQQAAKALHVGTYEAAVHNMLRRMHYEGDKSSQFYLYRVHLTPSITVRKDWLIEPGDWLGDVALAEVCPAGVDVARYLNTHEDPGGLSLALGRSAIANVQQVTVPLADPRNDSDMHEAIAALGAASVDLAPEPGILGRLGRRSSPRALMARNFGTAWATRLPANLADDFKSALSFDEGTDPEWWARRATCMLDLVRRPDRVLAALDATELSRA